jgi:hypothetical protein
VTDWLVPSAGQKIPVHPDWYLPLQKIPIAENRFLQACKVRELKIQGKVQAVLYNLGVVTQLFLLKVVND